MDLILALVGAVVAVLWLGFVLAAKPTRRRRAGPTTSSDPQVSFPRPGQAVAILPVTAGLSSPGTTRLVDEFATSVLERFPDARHVEVRTPNGLSLGTRSRSRPRQMPTVRSAPLPQVGATPRVSRLPAIPLPSRSPSVAPASARGELPAPRPLADRLELPTCLRAGVADPDDPADIVEQILRAGGHLPERSGDLLRLNDQVLVVLRVPVGSMVGRDDLNRAYAEFGDSGAFWGMVVAAGYFPSREISRRQAMAPQLRYAGFSDLLRMADAAAAGADPLAFATAARVTRSGEPAGGHPPPEHRQAPAVTGEAATRPEGERDGRHHPHR